MVNCEISSLTVQVLQNHYFITNEDCCSTDVPFNIVIHCTIPCMSSQGKVKIVLSKLSLLCPLVSLECAAKYYPNTAASSCELEFSPHRLKSKMQTHGYSDMGWFFSGGYRLTNVWTKSVLPVFLMHMSEGKGRQLESIFNTAQKCWNKSDWTCYEVVGFMNKVVGFKKLQLKNYLLEEEVHSRWSRLDCSEVLGWLSLADSLTYQLLTLVEVTVQSYEKFTVIKGILKGKKPESCSGLN